MKTTKKSMEWLEPLELSEKEALKFQKMVKKPISKSKLQEQMRIFKVAKKLKD